MRIFILTGLLVLLAGCCSKEERYDPVLLRIVTENVCTTAGISFTGGLSEPGKGSIGFSYPDSPSVTIASSSLKPIEIDANGSSEPIQFRFGHTDPNIDADSLTVSYRSLNPDVIGEEDLLMTPIDANNRSFQITPSSGVDGEAVISVSILDAAGVSADFDLKVVVTGSNS